MDFTLLSFLVSILAFIISLLVFWDNRKKTQIMDQQLRLLGEETESKREIRKAIRVIDRIQEKIAKLKTALDFGDFGAISYLRLMEKLHDYGKDVLPLRIKIHAIDGSPVSSFSSFGSFQRFFEEKARNLHIDNYGILRGSLEARLTSSPDLEVDRIELEEYAYHIYSIRAMHEELKNVEQTVNLYDRSIISEILTIYLGILDSFFNGIKIEHTLNINLKMTSKQILDEPYEIISLHSWKGCVSDMQNKIMPRLYDLKKQLLKSL